MAFSRFRRGVLGVALLLLLLSWVQVGRASAGLVTRRWQQEGVPLLFMGPAAAENIPYFVYPGRSRPHTQPLIPVGRFIWAGGWGRAFL